ncbi:hypothetical protein G6F24_012711 [Rhizopus arrhizus]|nr:hypothetical protein G6F24_012711 [Rhizopus arrhizus]
MNNFSTSKKKQYSLQQETKKSSTTLSNKHNDSLSLALAQQSSKRTMLKTYHSKRSDYPPNAPHLEHSIEEDGKTNAFDREFVEQLQKARFEDKITRNATMSGRGNFSNYNRGFTYGTRGRGGSRGSWRGNWSRGNSFQFGDNRTKIQQQPITISTPPQQPTTTPTRNNKTTTSSQNYMIPQDGLLPGGRLGKFYHYWTQITSHKWPLSIVKEGYKIQFASKPAPWKLKKSTPLNQSDQQAVNEAVNKFLTAGIIEYMPNQSENYLSKFFTIQESTKRRPILDCQRLNQHIQCEHFKMEGVPALREIIEKDDFLCKIDLKDAYTVVPIHQDSRRFLTFKNEGIVYQYRSLAFGLNVAPRLFSKLMRYAIEPLRQEGIRLVYYLDDICLLGKSKEELTTTSQKVIAHLQKLGFIINMEKSVLIPSQMQEFLGFQFNTKKMKITVPIQKINRLLQRIKQASQPVQRSCRWIAGLLGKVTSMIPAIGEALLHIRYLQRDLAKSLHLNHQNWERPCYLSRQSLQELLWWKESVSMKNGLPIQTMEVPTPQITIYTDSSETGWGISSPFIETFGFWSETDKTHSINVRELKAVYYALKIHATRFENCTIKVEGQHHYSFRS